jgi:hypothetical protein
MAADLIDLASRRRRSPLRCVGLLVVSAAVIDFVDAAQRQRERDERLAEVVRARIVEIRGRRPRAGAGGVTFYHVTNGEAAAAILARGFEDAEGTFGTGELFRGVWISATPLSANEGAHGDHLLAVEISEELVAEFEWIEDENPIREFLVPAEVLNAHGHTRLLEVDRFQCWEAKP